MGGIMTVEDAVEFLLAGATCVAVGTGNFWQPTLAGALVGQLADYLGARGLNDVNQLVGKVGKGGDKWRNCV
jgi:dihydroorotate dehydrogenase (NAD+) catalytic subunit